MTVRITSLPNFNGFALQRRRAGRIRQEQCEEESHSEMETHGADRTVWAKRENKRNNGLPTRR